MKYDRPKHMFQMEIDWHALIVLYIFISAFLMTIRRFTTLYTPVPISIKNHTHNISVIVWSRLRINHTTHCSAVWHAYFVCSWMRNKYTLHKIHSVDPGGEKKVSNRTLFNEPWSKSWIKAFYRILRPNKCHFIATCWAIVKLNQNQFEYEQFKLTTFEFFLQIFQLNAVFSLLK